MIETCGYCRIDSAGQHEYNCPCKPSPPVTVTLTPGQFTFAPNPVTEEDVRRIIREELDRVAAQLH